MVGPSLGTVSGLNRLIFDLTRFNTKGLRARLPLDPPLEIYVTLVENHTLPKSRLFRPKASMIFFPVPYDGGTKYACHGGSVTRGGSNSG